MAFGTNRGYMSRSQADAALYDAGLRAYMLRVYNYMVAGLGLTGVTAYLVATVPSLQALFFTVTQHNTLAPNLFGWAAIIAPVALVFFLSFRVHSMSASTAQTVFWVYAGLTGISLANILFAYTGVSVARVFFITAGTFAAMSLWGYTTKKDLTGMGTFLFMGLIGILIAGLVNIFLQSSMLHFVMSVIGVIVFVGLTAYDTQKIKEMYLEDDIGEVATKKAIMGALTLYLDFINLFIMLMQLFGQRRD